jgi:hypothetical protein
MFIEASNRSVLVMAARVEFQVSLCGIYGGRSGTGANFLTSTFVSSASSHFHMLCSATHPGLAQWARHTPGVGEARNKQ